MSDKRIISDWVKAKERAKKRGSTKCKQCNIEWTPIFLSPLEKGQYKTTCSLKCTKELQKNVGKTALKKLWNNKERMVEVSSKGGRQSASKQVRRSKDEIQLYLLCVGYFKNVESNKILVDGWDADIIVEDHKLAILWNGPWHYKEMNHKNHSLSQVQRRDKIKKDALTKNGYNVVIFEDRYYTPTEAFEELKIIAGIQGKG